MRITVRRELLDLPHDELHRRADAAWRKMDAAHKQLRRLPDSADMAAFVDTFESYTLAQREFAQLATALAIDRVRA